MSPDAPPVGAGSVIVHGLLVCRNAELSPDGHMNVQEILEVIALDEIPGDAGPLTFVAFVRNLPPGPGQAAFVIHVGGRPEHEVARLPLSFDVPAALTERQVSLQVRMPEIPVKQGGWFEVVFEWDGKPLARNRFAIGSRAQAPEAEPKEA